MWREESTNDMSVDEEEEIAGREKWETKEKGWDNLTFFLLDVEQRECQNLVTFGILYKDDWHQLLSVRVWETCCVRVCGHDWHGELERSTGASVLYRQTDSRKM